MKTKRKGKQLASAFDVRVSKNARAFKPSLQRPPKRIPTSKLTSRQRLANQRLTNSVIKTSFFYFKRSRNVFRTAPLVTVSVWILDATICSIFFKTICCTPELKVSYYPVMTTSLQWSHSSVLKAAVVERFECNRNQPHSHDPILSLPHSTPIYGSQEIFLFRERKKETR